jgi:hypothetical protein
MKFRKTYRKRKTNRMLRTRGGDNRIGIGYQTISTMRRFGGKTRRNLRKVGAGCGCGISKNVPLPPGLQLGELTRNLQHGGGCGCGLPPPVLNPNSELLQGGGGCPCQAVQPLPVALGGGKKSLTSKFL